MEKLELRHLAPYLPYGLKMYLENLKGKPIEGWVLRLNALTLVIERQNKPILRPLSDLTKEIEHEGKIFRPCDMYSNLKNEHNPATLALSSHYICMQSLFEWHFDVFGLIDAGLAINYNEL